MTLEEIRYKEAQKEVKKIKGFYTHAIVYIVVNIFIVYVNISNLDEGETYFQWKNFTTAIFWGLGLLAHGLSVFFPAIVLGKDWEERKIREFMENEKLSRRDN